MVQSLNKFWWFNSLGYFSKHFSKLLFPYFQSQEEVCDLKHAAPFQNIIPKPFIPLKGKYCIITQRFKIQSFIINITYTTESLHISATHLLGICYNKIVMCSAQTSMLVQNWTTEVENCAFTWSYTLQRNVWIKNKYFIGQEDLNWSHPSCRWWQQEGAWAGSEGDDEETRGQVRCSTSCPCHLQTRITNGQYYLSC